MKARCVAAVGVLVLMCTPAAAATAAVHWHAPAAPEVAWRGMLATEGGAVGMGAQIGLYPAIGAVGLLAAIFTHAAISHSVQSAERKREQDDADRVLAPYSAALATWPAAALWQAAAATAPSEIKLLASGAPADGPAVETAPVFTLAQDESVLVLDAAVKLTPEPGALPVETVVRVVSSPHSAADARTHWAVDEARQLKATAAAMLAHAVQTALRHGAPVNTAGEPLPMRTYRYLQGGVERSERAQQVAGNCSRAVLRNLRGWLLSVPLRPAGDAPCTRDTAF